MTIQDKNNFIVNNFEEIRNLRKIITHQGKGVVSFTSIVQDSAVAGMASELAKALYQQHFKTIIIDTNTIHPTVHEWFKSLEDKNLVYDTLDDSLKNSTPIISVLIDGDKSLDIMSCRIATEQRDIFSSIEFKSKIQDLKSDYDYVLLCLPPIKDNFETNELISISDQTYALVHMNKDEFTDVSKALHSLHLAGNKLDGWITVNRKTKKYPYFENLIKMKSK